MKRGIRNRSNVKIRLDLTKRMVILSARASNSKFFLKNLELASLFEFEIEICFTFQTQGSTRQKSDVTSLIRALSLSALLDVPGDLPSL